ncbi:MAG: prefoldin subunit alpha [Haloferacaceae archaeon]
MMNAGGGQQQLQQLQQALEVIEGEIAELKAEVEGFREEQQAIDEAIEAIGVLDTGSTIQVPLGGGAYVRAEVQDIDEIIVSLGGGYAAGQPQDDAIDALERKRDALDDRIEDVQEEISELEDESEELEEQLEGLQGQLQQQQMQQLQQMQEGEDE